MTSPEPKTGKEIPPSPVYNDQKGSDPKVPPTGRVSPAGSTSRDEDDDSCNFCNFSWLEKCSNVVTAFIEKIFYKLVVFYKLSIHVYVNYTSLHSTSYQYAAS